MEAQIRKALKSRLQHLRDNAESLSLMGVRRLLEKDMGLETYALDEHKKLIKEITEKFMEGEDDHSEDTQIPKITESDIVKAVWERASHIEDNSDTITPAGVRRLLEEDMGLPVKTLDPFKNFISTQIDEVFESVGPNKRKVAEKEVSVSNKKQKTFTKKVSEGDEDSSSSEVSSEKPSRSKQVATPRYGKRVERLRSIIKACGMSVPPTLYKKAKQVVDEKREHFLINELEEILLREGLSKNPSEKEIKEVKKRKETAKELEGIDLGNIVWSSRRRTSVSASFMAPPKPKARAKQEDDDEEDDDSDKEMPKEKQEKEEDMKEEEEEEKEEDEAKEEDDDEEEEEEEEEESKSESESESESEEEYNEDDDDDY